MRILSTTSKGSAYINIVERYYSLELLFNFILYLIQTICDNNKCMY